MRKRVSSRSLAGLMLLLLSAAGAVPVGASPEAMQALGILQLRERTAAPNVTLATLNGKALSLDEFKGKVVLVNFWATWCLPCQWEMPLMEKLYQAYKAKGFVIIAISLDREGSAVVEPFVREKKLTYPVALDQTFQGARQFGVRGIPATFLIGRAGFIEGVTYGPREWDGPEARVLIESLLRIGKHSKG